MSEVVLVCVLLAGAVAALLPRFASRVLAVAAAGAVVLAVVAVSGSPVERWGMALTGIAPLALILTTAMGATVVTYANRSLRHEPYRKQFTVLASLLVASASVVAVAENLVLLLAAWVATSLVTVAMLRTGPERGRAERSRRALRAFVIGDTALAVAVVLMVADRAPVAAGVLAVTAAAARSSAGPFYRWLPATVGAPTPSSALLHAGVINGGAILLIKLAPQTTGVFAVAVATAVLGALTCVFAEAVMLTRPDIKGRLAWSTTAQMGFTLLLCGVGLPLAAGLHLVAHGFYKGSLFLGSGTSVRAAVRNRRSPSPADTARPSPAAAAALAYTVPAAAMAGTVFAIGATWTANLAVPCLLAAIASGEAGRAALTRTDSRRGSLLAIVVIGSLAASYVAATIGLESAMHANWTDVAPAMSPLWLAPVLAALAAIALTHHRQHSPTSVEAQAWAAARRVGRPDPVIETAEHRPAAKPIPPQRHPNPIVSAPRPSEIVAPRPELVGALT